MSITTVKVKSSMLSSVSYDNETKELIVSFNNGGEYKYIDVPESAFNALISNEDSIGKYFTTNIKTRYKYEKI